CRGGEAGVGGRGHHARDVLSGSGLALGLRVPLPRRTLQMPSVRETAVVSRERITAQRDGHDLINLGRAGVGSLESRIDGLTAQPAVGLLGQHAASYLVAPMAISSAG